MLTIQDGAIGFADNFIVGKLGRATTFCGRICVQQRWGRSVSTGTSLVWVACRG